MYRSVAAIFISCFYVQDYTWDIVLIWNGLRLWKQKQFPLVIVATHRYTQPLQCRIWFFNYDNILVANLLLMQLNKNVTGTRRHRLVLLWFENPFQESTRATYVRSTRASNTSYTTVQLQMSVGFMWEKTCEIRCFLRNYEFITHPVTLCITWQKNCSVILWKLSFIERF